MTQFLPSIDKIAFNCPHCGVLAQQYWHFLLAGRIGEELNRRPVFGGPNHPFFQERPEPESLRDIHESFQDLKELRHTFVSECFHCRALSIWAHTDLVYPQRGEAPLANPDLPEDIRRDYDEASSILSLSPRGAAALLRLALQKLCKELGQPGENINDDIKALVADGLDPVIQQAVDSIRVVGNKAVHPGEIDLREDPGTAERLFDILNLIVERMISVPKHVEEFYEALPEEERKKIEKRDGGKRPLKTTAEDAGDQDKSR